MIQTIRKAWGIPELRKKIIFTLLILLIFRIGNTITVPYIDVPALKLQLDTMGSTYFGLLNAISGGAFSMATVFSNGNIKELSLTTHNDEDSKRLIQYMVQGC